MAFMPVLRPLEQISVVNRTMAFKATYKLLADMIHHAHHSVLAPPIRILDTVDLSTHDNDLTSWNQLATTIGGSEMLWHARWRNLAIQCLC
jgi:hypothetical protein